MIWDDRDDKKDGVKLSKKIENDVIEVESWVEGFFLEIYCASVHDCSACCNFLTFYIFVQGFLQCL